MPVLSSAVSKTPTSPKRKLIVGVSGPETAPIAAQANAALLVSRRDRLRGRALAHVTEMLENAKAAPVGLTLAS